jgi:hypothetical protein
MSDKIIRLSSQQGFADTWVNANVPTNLNLCDFRIPRGMCVSLRDSYISYNVSITADTDQPVNAMLQLNSLAADGAAYQAPNAALVRNARISCDRGQIESLRRVDTLACAMWNLEHDAEEQKDDMNAFVAPKSVRGKGNQTSYLLDAVSVTVDDNDVSIPGAVSRNLARDVKIPLKDIFGIGQVDDWDTNKFGETLIHLETNWKAVKTVKLGGTENADLSFDGTNTWGKMDNPVPNIPTGTGIAQMVQTFVYSGMGDVNQYCPFYQGQSILCNFTVSRTGGGGPGGLTDQPAIIQDIAFNEANGQITITTAANFYENTGGAGVDTIQDLIIRADNTYTLTNAVNRAELVLFTKPDEEGEDEYQYVTYTTEQDNGNAIKSFQRGYVVEPEAQNLFVALCPAPAGRGEILPGTDYDSYRLAVDNVDMTGNRSVVFQSTLNYDRVQRSLTNTSTGMGWRNAQFKFFNWTPNAPLQADAWDRANSTICETLELTQSPKYVDLQIECSNDNEPGTLREIILYKQMVRSISA